MERFNRKILNKDNILSEMVYRLVDAFHPECIYLYGSRARLQERPDSDYDLFLIVPSSTLPQYRRAQKAFRALCGINASKEVIVLTRKEFESKRAIVCSLPATIEREGKILYAS